MRLNGPNILVMVALLQLAVLVMLSVLFAVWFRPEPISDWLDYWTAAGDLQSYVRGGMALWLLGIPKTMGFPPWAGATLLNVPAIAWMWFLAYRVDHSRYRVFAQLIVLYLLLITPFASVVQLDLLGATMFATGLWLLLDSTLSMAAKPRLATACLFIAAAVSSRTQYALTLWVMIPMLAVAWLLFRRVPKAVIQRLLVGLLMGSVLGIAFDGGLRLINGRSGDARIGQVVTIYTGLLTSGEAGACGAWNPQAGQAAIADLGKPLATAIADRLAAQSPSHWVAVVKCKTPNIILPSAYAMYWLIASPNVEAKMGALPAESHWRALVMRLQQAESLLYRPLVGVILLVCFAVPFLYWRRARSLALLPVLWLVSFWMVHAVFEIQGRYFLGMLLIAPLVCALVWRSVAKSPVRARPDGEAIS